MSETNPNSRLETFCDGVFAIALTLLIIDIKIPATAHITNTAEFWHSLRDIAPSIVTFVLSFTIILISWVNHHATLKMVNKSSASFIYANGFLLLTVVFIPFPTSLVGEYILTDHAAPAMILYNAVIVFQSIGWILLCHTALKNGLTKNEKATHQVRLNLKNGYYSTVVYSLLAILAVWLPLTIAVITVLLWIYWLVYGISIKHE